MVLVGFHDGEVAMDAFLPPPIALTALNHVQHRSLTVAMTHERNMGREHYEVEEAAGTLTNDAMQVFFSSTTATIMRWAMRAMERLADGRCRRQNRVESTHACHVQVVLKSDEYAEK